VLWCSDIAARGFGHVDDVQLVLCTVDPPAVSQGILASARSTARAGSARLRHRGIFSEQRSETLGHHAHSRYLGQAHKGHRGIGAGLRSWSARSRPTRLRPPKAAHVVQPAQRSEPHAAGERGAGERARAAAPGRRSVVLLLESRRRQGCHVSRTNYFFDCFIERPAGSPGVMSTPSPRWLNMVAERARTRNPFRRGPRLHPRCPTTPPGRWSESPPCLNDERRSGLVA